MAQKKDAPTEDTAPLPLFYKEPVALDARQHGSLSLKKNFGFGFTSSVNAVPINMIEMPQICHHYPIAFSPDSNATPVAVLGLRDGENLFLSSDSKWDEQSYVPSYIRRYPFIFSEIPDTEQLTLCVDNVSEVIEEKGDQPFFDEEGKPTKLAENALEFCKSYHAAAQQTQLFSKALADAGVLIERSAQINVAGNKTVNFSGFRIIDEKKLSELDDETIVEWHKKGWMGFVYAHLFSGAQWQNLARRLNERMDQKAA